MKRIKIGYLIAGMLIMALLNSTAIQAFAASTEKLITAYFSGIKIYVDDKQIQPKDAAGNITEPFIYNGTTYLPVRAVADALGENVVWDGKTSSIYIGEHDSDTAIANLTEMDCFYTNESDGYAHTHIIKPVGSKDNIGNMHYKGMLLQAPFEDTIQRVYLINQKYSVLKGEVALAYEDKDNKSGVGMSIYGDDKLLYSSPLMKAGSYPEAFKVDVSGVVELKLEWYGENRQMETIILSGLDFYQ